jgi:hypothetical protein
MCDGEWILGRKCMVFQILMHVEASWNVMAHAQKPHFVFRRNGRVHLNRRGRQFSRLLAAEVCASALVILDTPCSEVVWRVLATHSIHQFPLHFPSRASPCAITFQLESITKQCWVWGRVATSTAGKNCNHLIPKKHLQMHSYIKWPLY